MAAEFSWPRDDEHTAVWGRNGTGKTQLATYVLSKQNFKRKPWVIIDYKGDELLNSIERTREISYDEIPEKPGLYILHARPDMSDEMEQWLWKIWERENIGLYADEGYLLPKSGTQEMGAYDTIQVQGRSKRIPTITLSQRPTRISRMVVSEASHVAMFDLNDDRDYKTAESIVPRGFGTWVPPEFGREKDLPPYHARWYAVKSKGRFVLTPVPEAEEIRDQIDRQLEPRLRWL
jgi:DNA helicase HerA-like ATPase